MRNFACRLCLSAHVRVCVCVRETQLQRRVCVCVCARVCKSGRHCHTTAACLQTHTSFITVSGHATLFPSWACTDGKTKDIISCLYFSFES